MPLRLVVAPLAQDQIGRILQASTEDFGQTAADRYRKLLSGAFHLLSRRPDQPLSRSLLLDDGVVSLFHLRHARRLAPSEERVASPRHVVVYRYDSACLLVAQILHDRMDIPARLR
ncbi:type II toxin-antitoxin system RelE/ParE family toxin [Pseudomonas sp. ODNR1LW]|nr:type II toxin-antitoxin system RelE/ParE family toxin [Pseudomonas sp. ODNR1LW]